MISMRSKQSSSMFPELLAKAEKRFLVSGNDDLEDDAHQGNGKKRRNNSLPTSSFLHF